ncbi:MAG: hypothetical protein WDZ40_00720 [Candidatus Spechtbacterales bacterium]
MNFILYKSNKLVRVLLAAYIVAGLVFAFAPQAWFPAIYMLPLMSKLSFLSAFLVLLPVLLIRVRNKKEEDALKRFQGIVAFGLFINSLGGLGLYKLYQYGFQYDKLTHYVTPLVLTVGFTELFMTWRGWTKKRALLFSAILVFAGGIVWEFLEFYSDRLLDTTLVGLGGEHQRVDTTWDIIFNTLGIVSALIYLQFKSRNTGASKEKQDVSLVQEN